jgi:branched-chain amino acid transport system permease protein
MPSWEDFKPFIVTGLALGGVYALSGVGMVVLYRATGVLNLAFGAVGAMGALLSWQLINHNGWAEGPAFLFCVLFGGAITLLYGVIFGPPLSGRDPLVKAVATLGLALVLLWVMDLVWSDKARSMILPTSNHGFRVSDIFVNWTQVIAVGFALAVMTTTALFLRFTKTGTAMRALANDREITATLGVPVRRVEAAAWLGSGLVSGASGLLLSNLVGLDAATLTFLVISSLAATLIGRLRSITVTFIAGIVIGLVNALVTPILSISQYRDMTPFILATIALLVLSGRRGSALAGRAG